MYITLFGGFALFCYELTEAVNNLKTNKTTLETAVRVQYSNFPCSRQITVI